MPGPGTGAGGGPLRFEEIHTRLRDGTRVLLRPIRADDRARLVNGFAHLSAASRFRRFMTPVTELSDAQLDYLTEIDYFDHFAWVAELEDPTALGIGVGRYVRLQEDPALAEAAVTVLDDYQGRGLGTLLLGMLAATARMAGIERFRAYVLEENEPMLELLRELGAEAEYDSAGVVRLDVPLRPEMLPDSPVARLLRLAATLTQRSAVVEAAVARPRPPRARRDRHRRRDPRDDATDPDENGVVTLDPMTGVEPSVVRSLDHVYYWVSDMDRAVAFYRDVLGLRPERRAGASWAVFDIDGRTLALHGAVDGRPISPGGATAVFEVADLDAAQALLGSRGVTFDHQGDVEGYARFASFRDPDGNTLQLIEYAPAVASGGDA